jgi:hypothetical protein
MGVMWTVIGNDWKLPRHVLYGGCSIIAAMMALVVA